MKSCIFFIVLFLPSVFKAQNYQEAATDHCNCFRSMDSTVSSFTKQLLINASYGKSFTDSLKSQMRQLNVRDQLLFKDEFDKMSLELEDENNAVAKCLANLENKHRSIYLDDTGPKMQKLIQEMRKINCKLLAAIMVMGIEWIEKDDQ